LILDLVVQIGIKVSGSRGRVGYGTLSGKYAWLPLRIFSFSYILKAYF
jgi:hypothetical protein